MENKTSRTPVKDEGSGLSMNDRFFLVWVYNRLERVHGENKNVDYMLKLRAIIDEKVIADDDFLSKLQEIDPNWRTETLGDEGREKVALEDINLLGRIAIQKDNIDWLWEKNAELQAALAEKRKEVPFLKAVVDAANNLRSYLLYDPETEQEYETSTVSHGDPENPGMLSIKAKSIDHLCRELGTVIERLCPEIGMALSKTDEEKTT